MKRVMKRISLGILVACLMLTCILCTGCSRMGEATDPSTWGYNCKVIYDVLGGKINSLGIRTTYYQPGSLLFAPTGTTNMLVQPVKDGYLLAGWYTHKEDVEKDGKVVDYRFNSQDRWDFNTDRVQGDMTLYARWIKQGEIRYKDCETGEQLFAKPITSKSSVQPLSSATLSLIAKPGYSMEGYFKDQSATEEYSFSDYQHSELLPEEKDLYETLQKEFPEQIVNFDVNSEEAKAEQEAEEKARQAVNKAQGESPKNSEGAQEVAETGTEGDSTPKYSWSFLHKLGYDIQTEDPAVIDKIHQRKNELVEESISHYMENTANKEVWINFTLGRVHKVESIEDLKLNGKYGFFGKDEKGRLISEYDIQTDLDFSGKKLGYVDEFSGQIHGNGHTISNLTVQVIGQKKNMGKPVAGALFGEMVEAGIDNLKFSNLNLEITAPKRSPVTAAPIALSAARSSFKDIEIEQLTIQTGKGDDGRTLYKIADFVVDNKGSTFDNVTIKKLIMESKTAELSKQFAP